MGKLSDDGEATLSNEEPDPASPDLVAPEAHLPEAGLGSAPAGHSGPRAGRMARTIFLLRSCALAAMVAGLVADVVSRFFSAGDSVPRFGIIATLVAVLAFGLALALGLVTHRGIEHGKGQAFAFDVNSLALLVLSLAMRAAYWEIGMGTPVRAALPLAAALGIQVLSLWGQRASSGTPAVPATSQRMPSPRVR